MKIGILTFHWATNYGAILQAFCLQEFLRKHGHDVEIINYKPKCFDFSWKKYFSNPKYIKNLRRDLINKKKESLLVSFRNQYLAQTKRYYTTAELQSATMDYDILISGSDQILNPSYTMNGEGRPSSAYYLSFGSNNIKRIGYAVSFGCVEYPKHAVPYATEWIKNFNAIGTREKTGLDILNQLKYDGFASIVPDPTILYGHKLYEDIGIQIPVKKQNYTCIYMLRHEIKVDGKVKYIDETRQPLTMQEWLFTISSASGLITNSYHGMIMAILAQVPFAVLLESGKASGMNDRFITLLDKLKLNGRICNNIDEVKTVLLKPIDFDKVNDLIKQFQLIGDKFIEENI